MMELKRVCVVFRNQELLQTKSWIGRNPDPKPEKPVLDDEGTEDPPVIPPGSEN